MSVQLLDKTRKINKLLHNNNSSKVLFNDKMCIRDSSGAEGNAGEKMRTACDHVG